MTSQIVSTTIDENFPVAGQDNDSQGFRDNFAIIKTALATATSEVTDLQTNSARLNVANNFNGTLIDNAQTNRLYGTVYSSTSPTTGVTSVVYENGEYQKFIVGGNHSLRLLEFPAGNPTDGKYSKIRIELKPNVGVPSIGYIVSFISGNGGSVIGTVGFTQVGENPAINIGNNPTLSTVVEVWTTDGQNFFVGSVGGFDTSLDLDTLSDVTLTSLTTNQVLKYDGTKWVNGTVTVGAIASLENVGDVTGYTAGSLTNGDILKWNGTKWSFANDPTISALDDIPNVNVSLAVTGNLLKYDGTNWISGALPINDLSDVVIGGDPLNTLNTAQVLKYDGTNWVNIKLELGELKNVSIATPAVGDVVRYNPISQAWRNESDPNIYVYAVDLPPNFDGNDGYEIDGTVIEEGLLTFHVGNIYRFNLGNPLNAQSALKFSTDAAGTQPYTTNVRTSGTEGTVGSYIEIEITKDTPTPLYIYGGPGTEGAGPFPLGQNVPIAVIKDGFYTGSEDLANAAEASAILSTSYFSTGAAETATLAAGSPGQVKVFAMAADNGDMVITVANAGWKASGSGTVTFDTIGQACTLHYINSKWYCIGNNGATFA